MRMRKPFAAEIAARTNPPGGRADAPTELVCVALVLALLMLAARIASVW
jgi:hypothetical protein